MVSSAFWVCEQYKECPEIKTPMTECTNSNRNNQATLFPWDKVWFTFGFCMLISYLISFDLMAFAALIVVLGGQRNQTDIKNCRKSSINNESILKQR